MSELNNLHPTLSPEELEDKIQVLVTELKARLFDITQENFKNPNCIDGRDQDNARPSIPGWGLGALGVVLAYLDTENISVDRNTVVRIVKDYFGGHLTWHTDNHNHPEGHQCQWCGHAQRLITQGERYNLQEDSSKILEQEADLIPDHKLDTLQWDHEERNVFIVNIPGKGIKANTDAGQDFVYNAWYAEELYREIADKLETELGIQVDIETVLSIANAHFLTTGWDLAKNKDVFGISDNNTDGTPEVQYLMTVAA